MRWYLKEKKEEKSTWKAVMKKERPLKKKATRTQVSKFVVEGSSRSRSSERFHAKSRSRSPVRISRKFDVTSRSPVRNSRKFRLNSRRSRSREGNINVFNRRKQLKFEITSGYSVDSRSPSLRRRSTSVKRNFRGGRKFDVRNDSTSPKRKRSRSPRRMRSPMIHKRARHGKQFVIESASSRSRSHSSYSSRSPGYFD